jgi:hypothetical protein
LRCSRRDTQNPKKQGRFGLRLAHNFHLHCKGGQARIDAFIEKAKALTAGKGDMGAGADARSLRFLYFHHVDRCHTLFCRLIKEFSDLSLFFTDSYTADGVEYFDYFIFEKGVRLTGNEWHFDLSDYPGVEEYLDAIDKCYEKIAPVLREWREEESGGPKNFERWLDKTKWGSEAFKILPDALRTSEFYLAVVRISGQKLKYVPAQFKSAELCRVAFEENAGAFEYMPKKLKTPELCLAAVEEDGAAFDFIPEALQTPELEILAEKNHRRKGL